MARGQSLQIPQVLDPSSASSNGISRSNHEVFVNERDDLGSGSTSASFNENNQSNRAQHLSNLFARTTESITDALKDTNKSITVGTAVM